MRTKPTERETARATGAILRPGRGPSDEQVDYTLGISQGGLMAFALALHDPICKLKRTKVVFNA